MFINTTSGELALSVDDSTKVIYLKSYTRQDFTTLLDWSQHSSAIYFGGKYFLVRLYFCEQFIFLDYHEEIL